MGPYEHELKSIVEQGDWQVQNLVKMRIYFLDLAQGLEAIVLKAEDWEGAAANAGKGVMANLSDWFAGAENTLQKVDRCITAANYGLMRAKIAYDALPSNSIPSWLPQQLRDAADEAKKITSIQVGPWTFRPKATVQEVESFLGHQREDAAARALQTLDNEMKIHKEVLQVVMQKWAPQPDDNNRWPRDDFPTYFEPVPAASEDPPFTPTPSGIPPWTPPAGALYPVYTAPERQVGRQSIDDDLAPTNPGNFGQLDTKFPIPRIPLQPGTGGGAGAGLVPGLGGAAGAAGLAVAARVGAGGVSGLGGAGGTAGAAGARLGSGLSGAGGAAGGGSAAGAAGGRGGGSTSNVMGGGGGAAGGGAEKEKRSGLGGLIAPKLEDDEELGPRSAAAGAGGRE